MSSKFQSCKGGCKHFDNSEALGKENKRGVFILFGLSCIYQFRYNESGKRISSLISVPYNGYAKGYYSDQSDRFFKVVLKVVDGWIEVKKVWLPNGNKHILRSYERGVLRGR